MKRRIDYTSITIIEIKVDDEKRKTEILRQIFANLNRGGTLLSAQEQRNGIYTCEFYEMLQNFNRKDLSWRKIWGREDAKEKDLEVLLRLCALKKYVRVKENVLNFDFVIEGYKSSYVDMLDRFSEEAMEFDIEQINEYKESLSNFLNLFQVTYKQSSKVALLESFYVVYEKMGVKKAITDNIYNSILKNEQYKSCARQGTVQMKSMNERWKTIYEIWNRAD